jgi:DNA primase
MPAQDWSRVVRKSKRKGASDANAIPIDLIVQHYAGEVKYGSNLSVKCCMHDDSRRSAVIDTYNNLYYCHTCGKGGSAVDVVMANEEMGFKDALNYAVEIVERGGGKVQSKHKRRGSGISRRTWNI